MAKIADFTGWSVAYEFIVQPGANTIANDTNNKHGLKYVWVVPLTAGTMVATGYDGIALSVTFATKDINLPFALPVTAVASFSGTAGTLIAVAPAL